MPSRGRQPYGLNMRSRNHIVVVVVAVTVAAAGLVTLLARSPDGRPGVGVLEQWYEAAPRGDLAGDTALRDAAEAEARRKIGSRRITLHDEARVAFAVSTPTGAVAYVVQYSSSNRADEPDSLPAGAAIWFDKNDRIVKSVVDWPETESYDGTSPQNAPLTTGMWTSRSLRHIVLFDTGYGTNLEPGVLRPTQSSPTDLVRFAEPEAVDFGSDGYTVVTLADEVLQGTATLTYEQAPFVSNSVQLLYPSRSRLGAAALSFEDQTSAHPLRVRPFPAAYASGRKATDLARQWTRERISFKADLSGSPLQARLPDHARVLLRNVVRSKAYVALVQFTDGTVAGVRCTTPGRRPTVSCALPQDLGRLFTVDHPFSWKERGRRWRAAAPTVHVQGNYSAIVPLGATIRVEPRTGEPFFLYR